MKNSARIARLLAASRRTHYTALCAQTNGSLSYPFPRGWSAQITEIHLLAKTNETLLIGWKRPVENGVIISHYEMQLLNQHEKHISDQQMDVDVKSGVVRANYMYIFVNLEPGE